MLSHDALLRHWGARESRIPSTHYLCSLSLDKGRSLEHGTFVHDRLRAGFAQVALDFASFSNALVGHSSFEAIAKQYAEFVHYLEELPVTDNPADRRSFVELVMYLRGLQRNSMQTVATSVQEVMAELGSGYTAVQPLVDAMWHRFASARIKTEFFMAHYLSSLKKKDGFAGSFRLDDSPAATAQHVAEECIALCKARLGIAPEIIVQEQEAGSLTYVQTHLEYVLREIFKNACQAVVTTHGQGPDQTLPAIVCSISDRGEDVLLRVVDQGGGMTPEQVQKAWKFMHSTAAQSAWTSDVEGASLAGHGIGLPLSRLLLQHFGGDLQLTSQEGVGTQVDIILPKASPECE